MPESLPENVCTSQWCVPVSVGLRSPIVILPVDATKATPPHVALTVVNIHRWCPLLSRRTFTGEGLPTRRQCPRPTQSLQARHRARRYLSAQLERDLLAAGQHVVRVPPKLMAQSGASARTRGKSDPIAVARGYLRESDLSVACHDEVSRELKLLVDRREVLVAQRTATINRLRWRVHKLDPSPRRWTGSSIGRSVRCG